MRKNFIVLVLCTLAFGAGIGINNIAMSNVDTIKIAYVDINKLISKSNVIKQANIAREAQTKQMLEWYDSANNDIQKQQDSQSKQTLIKKYEAQLSQKKKSIKEQYNRELKSADSQMEAVVAQKSKELGYTYVFKKDALLFGGEDITTQILPLVK